MQQGPYWLLVGVLLGAAGVLLLHPQATPAPRGEAVGPAGIDAAAIVDRLEEVEVELRLLRDSVAASGSQRELAATLDEEIDGPVDLRALAQALLEAQDRREAASLEAASDQELLDLARRELREDPGAARRALEALLARGLDDAVRTQALSVLGEALRKAGDLLAAEQRLEEAARLGEGTEDGAWASYLWAMTVSEQGDDARALEIARTIGAVQGLGDWVRVHGEWATAVLSEKNGDLDGARSHYERLLAECADEDQFAWLIDDLSARLAGLR